MTPLPTLVFDPSELTSPGRLAAWQAAIPQYDVAEAEEPGVDFKVRASAWLAGDLIVTHTVVTAVALTREIARIRADGADTFNLHVMLRGSMTGSADGRSFSVGPGQLVGFDLSRPLVTRAEPSESVSVVIGRNAVRDTCRGEPDLHGLVFETAAGQLLCDHCLALARHLVNASTADAIPIARATLALLAAALPATSRDTGSTPASPDHLPQAIRRFVDRHLGEPDLGPDRIAAALGLSRATLYRSVKEIGGIAAYIQRRRLQAVRALLLHPSETRDIGEIAHALGFASRSHFAAAFRTEFGCAPREIRSRQVLPDRGQPIGRDAGAQFRVWLDGLVAQ